MIKEIYLLKRQRQTARRAFAYTLSTASLLALISVNCAVPFNCEKNGILRLLVTFLTLPVSATSIWLINEIRLEDEENLIEREAYLDWYSQQLAEATMEQPQTQINSVLSMPLLVGRTPEREKQAIEAIDISDDRYRELWQKLNQPENNFWISLLEAKPVLICGPQGSGKTIFASYLGLLRKIFLNHVVEVNDPHAHLNQWPQTFKIYGQNLNYSAIGQRLVAYYDRLKNPNSHKITSIWDEVTNYQERCPKHLTQGFLKSLLSDTRKSPEFPVIIAHGQTLSSLGGGKGGVAKMSEEGLIKIQLQVDRDQFGRPFPAMRGQIVGLYHSENGNPISTPIQLQKWMHPNNLTVGDLPDLPLPNHSETKIGKVTSSEILEETLFIPAHSTQHTAHTTETLDFLDSTQHTEHTCECGGKLRNNGKTSAGKLRLRCQSCGKSFSLDL